MKKKLFLTNFGKFSWNWGCIFFFFKHSKMWALEQNSPHLPPIPYLRTKWTRVVNHGHKSVPTKFFVTF